MHPKHNFCQPVFGGEYVSLMSLLVTEKWKKTRMKPCQKWERIIISTSLRQLRHLIHRGTVANRAVNRFCIHKYNCIEHTSADHCAAIRFVRWHRKLRSISFMNYKSNPHILRCGKSYSKKEEKNYILFSERHFFFDQREITLSK